MGILNLTPDSFYDGGKYKNDNEILSQVYMMLKNEAAFYKVDIDKSPLLKIKYGITQLPTFLFYKNGVYIDFVIGLISRETLIEKIENALK